MDPIQVRDSYDDMIHLSMKIKFRIQTIQTACIAAKNGSTFFEIQSCKVRMFYVQASFGILKTNYFTPCNGYSNYGAAWQNCSSKHSKWVISVGYRRSGKEGKNSL